MNQHTSDDRGLTFISLACLLTLAMIPVLIISATAGETPKNSGAQFVEEKDRVVLKRGTKSLLEIPLAKDDGAQVLANCLILMHGIKVRESFGLPSSGEIITLDGKHQPIPSDKVREFVGPRSYSHASGQWGVILDEEEGILSSYLFLRSNGRFEKHELGEVLGWRGDDASSSDNMLIVPINRHGSDMSLIIQPDGNFRIK